MTKTAVVALGGNALTRLGQSGTAAEMAANAAAMAAAGGEWAAITSPALLAATMAPEGEWEGTRIERRPSRAGQGR